MVGERINLSNIYVYIIISMHEYYVMLSCSYTGKRGVSDLVFILGSLWPPHSICADKCSLFPFGVFEHVKK